MLVDALAEEVARVGASSRDQHLSSQAAFVRALVDEIGRHHPSDKRLADLHEQLGDELSRLAGLAPGASAEDGARGGRRGDVLVVDDDVCTLRAEASVVRNLGYLCRAVTSGEEALREYERRPASIVLSDFSMPGLSGIELSEALKRHAPHTYVILVTAHDSATVLEGVRGGVDDFLAKPVDVDELSVRLRAAERLVEAIRVVQSVKDRLRARAVPAT